MDPGNPDKKKVETKGKMKLAIITFSRDFLFSYISNGPRRLSQGQFIHWYHNAFVVNEFLTYLRDKKYKLIMRFLFFFYYYYL